MGEGELENKFYPVAEMIWRHVSEKCGKFYDGETNVWLENQTLFVSGTDDWKTAADDFLKNNFSKHKYDDFEEIYNSSEVENFCDFAYSFVDDPFEWILEEWEDNILSYGVPVEEIILNGEIKSTGNYFRNNAQWCVHLRNVREKRNMKNERIAKSILAVAKMLCADENDAVVENDSTREAEIAEHKSNLDGNPSVYVGTYAKYNEGNLDGAWIDLTTFDSGSDFVDWCCTVLHGDEEDPELMYQDYENFPKEYYDESHIDENLWDEYLKYLDEYGEEKCQAVLDNGNDLSALDDAIDYPGCDDMGDVAYAIYQEMGKDAFSESAWLSCFEYERFGKELQWDYSEEEIEENGWSDMNDYDIGHQMIDELGLDGLNDFTNYIDFNKLGERLDNEGTYISYGSYADNNRGYLELMD